MESGAGWDDLRKQARRLENEIDAKLASFGKQSKDSSESEIEELLHRLQKVNSAMQALMSELGSSHTLVRHNNIYHELVEEFRRKRSSVKAGREHEELLHTFGSAAEARLNGDDYMQERASVQRSREQVDTVVNQAQAALSVLTTQRNLFGNIGSKVTGVGAALPSVNHLLLAIRKKKNQDTVILSAVISGCTFLMFLYWISK